MKLSIEEKKEIIGKQIIELKQEYPYKYDEALVARNINKLNNRAYEAQVFFYDCCEEADGINRTVDSTMHSHFFCNSALIYLPLIEWTLDGDEELRDFDDDDIRRLSVGILENQCSGDW